MKPFLPSLDRVGTPQQAYASRYLVALVVTLATAIEMLDATVVGVAVPAMMGSLGATLDEIAWVTTGYAIANAIVVPISTWLADRLGRRNFFALCVGVFTLASLLCGTSSSVGELVFWRIVQGLAGGGIIPGSTLILFAVFPAAEVGIGLAIWGSGLNIGPAIGPLVGGWLTDNFSWQWIFYINLPLGALTLLLALMYVPDSEVKPRIGKVDLAGLLLLAVAVGSIVALVERGERQGWFESGEVVAYALLFALATPLFIWHERRTPHPILDLGIFRNRQFVATLPLGAIVGAVAYMQPLAVSVYLQSLLGYTAFQASLAQLPFVFGLVVTFATVGKLSSLPTLDMRWFVGVGLFIAAVSLWMNAGLTLQASGADMAAMLAWRAVGIGMAILPLSSLCIARLPAHQVGDGNAMFNLFRQVGGSLGVAAFTSLMEQRTHINRAELASHIHAMAAPATERLAQLQQRFEQLGDAPARAAQRALQIVDGAVSQQAVMASFNQIYVLFAIATLLVLLAVPLMVTGNAASGATPGH